MSTVDTFENGALSYDTGLPSPVCMMYCESPMTVSVYKTTLTKSEIEGS